MPAASNVAVVTALAPFANVTLPGPLNLLQVRITATPVGNPSSVTEPFSDAPAGSVIVEPLPALTVGGRFVGVTTAGFTVIVAYFVLTFLLPTVFGLLATSQQWFHDLQPWVDIQFAQSGLFVFDGPLTGQGWAHIAVTSLTWLLVPLLVGLRLVLRTEVK